MAPGKKKAARRNAHIVFIDESGFLLIPCLMRTWAPRGQTPLHRHRTQRDKVSAISGISVSPARRRIRLYFRLHDDNIRQKEVCAFLRLLLRHLRGNVVVLLDNSKTHRGEPLRALRKRHPRLDIEYFPPYAPELNPDEGVWSLSKRALANSAPPDRRTLRFSLQHTLRRIGKAPAKLRGCIRQTGLPLFLP